MRLSESRIADAFLIELTPGEFSENLSTRDAGFDDLAERWESLELGGAFPMLCA